MTVQLNSTLSPTAIVVLLHLSLKQPPMVAATPNGSLQHTFRCSKQILCGLLSVCA